MASKKKASARSGGKELANVDAALAQEVAGIKDRVGAPETNNIRIKDKVFTFPDGRIQDTPLHMVVIDFMAWNTYYDRPYNANDPRPPVCFAYGQNVRDLMPAASAPEPQAESCAGCWANEFGSAANGTGKACKNTRRLVLVDPNEEPSEATLYTMSVPPTSTKGFDGFVNGVAQFYQKPPIAVVVKISFHPEMRHEALIFSDPQPNEQYREHFGRREEARLLLENEPDLSNYEPATTGRSASKKKAAAKKKAVARR